MAEKEYIEREATIEALKDNVTEMESDIYYGSNKGVPKDEIEDIVNEIPAADVVEVVHGEWKNADWAGVSVKGYMACSQCNVMIPTCNGTRYCLKRLYYCPNCGAKMDGKGD